MTFEWLSGRVAELDALDDQASHSDAQGRMAWWQQYRVLCEQTLDFVRQHPDEGKSLVEAMTLSEHIADKRFIARQLADYMSIEGHGQDAAECFATLLLDNSDADEAAEFALNDAVEEGRLTAADVAHIALVTVEFAKGRIYRLETGQSRPHQP